MYSVHVYKLIRIYTPYIACGVYIYIQKNTHYDTHILLHLILYTYTPPIGLLPLHHTLLRAGDLLQQRLAGGAGLRGHPRRGHEECRYVYISVYVYISRIYVCMRYIYKCICLSYISCVYLNVYQSTYVHV